MSQHGSAKYEVAFYTVSSKTWHKTKVYTQVHISTISWFTRHMFSYLQTRRLNPVNIQCHNILSDTPSVIFLPYPTWLYLTPVVDTESWKNLLKLPGYTKTFSFMEGTAQVVTVRKVWRSFRSTCVLITSSLASCTHTCETHTHTDTAPHYKRLSSLGVCRNTEIQNMRPTVMVQRLGKTNICGGQRSNNCLAMSRGVKMSATQLWGRGDLRGTSTGSDR